MNRLYRFLLWLLADTEADKERWRLYGKAWSR